MPSSDLFGRWGAKFQVYAGIELFIWMPALYATCYTLQPTARLMRTHFGQRSVERISACLLRYTPSYHETLTRLSAKIYGSPATRAFAEWALLMKVLAPVAFPAKMYVAHKIVERRREQHHELEHATLALADGTKPVDTPPRPPPSPPPPPPPQPAGRHAHGLLAQLSPRHAAHARESADRRGAPDGRRGSELWDLSREGEAALHDEWEAGSRLGGWAAPAGFPALGMRWRREGDEKA